MVRESTKKQIEGNWDQFRGRIKEMWGDVTDDELMQTEGKYDRVVGLIKKKTGKAESEIEQRLDNLTVQR